MASDPVNKRGTRPATRRRGPPRSLRSGPVTTDVVPGRAPSADRSGAPGGAGPGRIRDRGRVGAGLGLALWADVVVAGVSWPALWPVDPRAGLRTPPFTARWGWHPSGWAPVAILVGIALVFGFPRLLQRIPARRVPVVAGGVGAAWASLVALAGHGVSRLWTTLYSPPVEYLPFAGTIGSPGTFLRTYVERAGSYPTHVKSHPPGFVLLLWGMDRIGLGGVRWAALLVLVGWAVAVGAVVWTVGEVAADRDAAMRRAAPFVALLPGVVFAATTGDGFFAGAAAVAIALLVAATGRTGRRSDLLALAAGVAWGAALHLSYGFAPLVAGPLAVALVRRRLRPLVLAALGALAVVGAFVAAGFWWLDGLHATHGFYWDGLARYRPYPYFVFAGNLAALALITGPAASVGLGRIAATARRRAPAAVALAAGFLLALAAADLSGLSKAETERIWLPFAVWAAAAAGWAARRPTVVRGWLAVQVALTLGLELGLRTGW